MTEKNCGSTKSWIESNQFLLFVEQIPKCKQVDKADLQIETKSNSFFSVIFFRHFFLFDPLKNQFPSIMIEWDFSSSFSYSKSWNLIFLLSGSKSLEAQLLPDKLNSAKEFFSYKS